MKKVFRQSTGTFLSVEGVDMKAVNPPVTPVVGQRIVSIDPGRRDMIVALAKTWTEENKDSGVRVGEEAAEVIKMSTRQHAHESKRNRSERRTRLHLKQRNVSIDDKGATMSVAEYQSTRLLSPKVSSLEEYKTYIKSLGPILGPWLEVHRIGNVQRGKFEVYINRDKSLDQLCRRIVGKEGSSQTKPVLVAFGSGAQVCSSGFGYAPAPMKWLRKRLSLIHGARVTLVDEPYTSQKCCRCHSQLKSVFTTKKVDDIGNTKRVQVHGVKKCATCKNEKEKSSQQHPKYWHRDINAAWNILFLYLTLGKRDERPDIFCHAGS